MTQYFRPSGLKKTAAEAWIYERLEHEYSLSLVGAWNTTVVSLTPQKSPKCCLYVKIILLIKTCIKYHELISCNNPKFISPCLLIRRSVEPDTMCTLTSPRTSTTESCKRVTEWCEAETSLGYSTGGKRGRTNNRLNSPETQDSLPHSRNMNSEETQWDSIF